jgi:hypothetical protein
VIDSGNTETTGPGEEQIPGDSEDDSAIGDRNDDLEIPFG